MKHIIIASALALAVAGAARAESITERTGVNSILGVSPSTADFVNAAAISDMFEIQSGQIMKAKATGSAAAGFADHVLIDHSKTAAELQSLVANGAVKQQLPTALDRTHQMQLEKLQNASGTDMARIYIDDQVSAHRDAIDLFERYAKAGDNDALKQWADKTLPALRHHLDMAQELEKNRVGQRDGGPRTAGTGRSAAEEPSIPQVAGPDEAARQRTPAQSR